MDNAPTGLVIPFPDIEQAIGAYRRAFILPTTFGLMAHLTVIFPFMPRNEMTTAVTETLQALFYQIPPIEYTISGLATFPQVLYLEMDDERPFIELIQAVEREYPKYPSFGGQFESIIPHITIAKNETISQSEAEFLKNSPQFLPVAGVCRTVWLIEKRGDNYQMTHSFQLGIGDLHE
ncbi:MAG: 2'-5' RNA ligase family protein [Chloroflexota bacterium]